MFGCVTGFVEISHAGSTFARVYVSPTFIVSVFFIPFFFLLNMYVLFTGEDVCGDLLVRLSFACVNSKQSFVRHLYVWCLFVSRRLGVSFRLIRITSSPAYFHLRCCTSIFCCQRKWRFLSEMFDPMLNSLVDSSLLHFFLALSIWLPFIFRCFSLPVPYTFQSPLLPRATFACHTTPLRLILLRMATQATAVLLTPSRRQPPTVPYRYTTSSSSSSLPPCDEHKSRRNYSLRYGLRDGCKSSGSCDDLS